MLQQGDTLVSLVKSFGASGILLAALLIVLRYRPWERRTIGNGNSGEKSVSFWREEIGKVVRDQLEQFDKGRMEKFRAIVRDELEKFRRDINLR